MAVSSAAFDPDGKFVRQPTVALLFAGHMRDACDNAFPLEKQLTLCKETSTIGSCNVVLSSWSEIDGSAFGGKCGSLRTNQFNCAKRANTSVVNASTCLKRVANKLRVRATIVRTPYPARSLARYPLSKQTIGQYAQMIEGLALAASKASTDDILVRLRPDLMANKCRLNQDHYANFARLPQGVIRAFGAFRSSPRSNSPYGYVAGDNAFAARRATFMAFVESWNATMNEMISCAEDALRGAHVTVTNASQHCIPRKYHGHTEWSMSYAAERVGIALQRADNPPVLLLPTLNRSRPLPSQRWTVTSDPRPRS